MVTIEPHSSEDRIIFVINGATVLVVHIKLPNRAGCVLHGKGLAYKKRNKVVGEISPASVLFEVKDPLVICRVD